MEEITIGIKWAFLLWVIISQGEWLLNKWGKDFPVCKKCLVFWTTLILTNINLEINVFSAPIAAYIMYWIEKNETMEL